MKQIDVIKAAACKSNVASRFAYIKLVEARYILDNSYAFNEAFEQLLPHEDSEKNLLYMFDVILNAISLPRMSHP